MSGTADSPVAPLTPPLTPPPVISWTPTDGAAGYDLWINRTDVPQFQIVREQSLSLAQFETTVLPLGTYRVWVRAFTASHQSSLWSQPVSFSIDTIAASAPTFTPLASPMIDTTPTFEWTSLRGATGCSLYVRNLNTLAVSIWERPISGNTFTPTSPLLPGSYRAWIRAFAGNDVLGSYSDPIDFVVEGPPVLAVGNSATSGQPKFTWTAVGQVTRYELLVDRIDVAASGVINETALTGESFMPTTPLNSGTYRAWLRAVDNSGNMTGWSTAADFDVATAKLPEKIDAMFSLGFDQELLEPILAAILAEGRTTDASGGDGPRSDHNHPDWANEFPRENSSIDDPRTGVSFSPVHIDRRMVQGKTVASLYNHIVPMTDSIFEIAVIDDVLEQLTVGSGSGRAQSHKEFERIQ